MTNNESGFTLMESLVTIAIIMIVSFSVLGSFQSGIRGIANGIKAFTVSSTLIQMDYFIRERVDSLHVPYWRHPDDIIESFKRELKASKIGSRIKTISSVMDSTGRIRGLTVLYEIDKKEYKTSALFPFIAIVGGVK